MNITLKVNDRESWLELYGELRKCGMLQDVTVKDVSFGEDAFPIEIPVDISALTRMVGNPMVKPFRKKINETLERTLKAVLD
jgi:hypothetical protein